MCVCAIFVDPFSKREKKNLNLMTISHEMTVMLPKKNDCHLHEIDYYQMTKTNEMRAVKKRFNHFGGDHRRK